MQEEEMSSTPSSPTESPTLSDVTAQLQATLRSVYLQIQFPKPICLLDRWRIPLEKYQFRLKPCLQNCWRVIRDPVHVPMQDLFDPDDDIIRPRRIWIEGPTGYGKTSLAFKLALDWAKGEKYIAKNFDLVFVLQMRHLCTSRSLAEVLHELCNGYGNLVQTATAIDQCRARVLLIIDDYSDEGALVNPDVLALLRCETHQEMTVIVTSRHGCTPGEDVTRDFANFIQKRLSLDGVSLEHLESFLEANLFDLSSSVIQDLASQVAIFSDKFGSSVSKSPILVLLIAAASLEDSFDASQTRTEMFLILLNFIIRRSMREFRESPDKCPYFSVPFNPDKETKNSILIRLGKLAASAVIKERSQFDRKYLATHCGEEVLQLGLFVESHNLPIECYGDTTFYECIHSSMLEYMTAHYICFLYVNKKLTKFRNLVKTVWLCNCSRNLVFPFVAGLLPNLAPELFVSLKPWLREECADFERLTTVLQECNISNTLTDVVSPLLPETWTINDDTFCQTSLHNTLLDHALIAERVKCVTWDVSCPIRLQLLSEIPKLDLCGPMSHLDPSCLVGIQCDELCFELKYEDPSRKGPRNGWENIVSTTKHVKANKVSFCIDDHVHTMLSLLCNQATSGQLQDITIESIECNLVMSKQCMTALTTLIRKEKIRSLHLTLVRPTSKRKMSASEIQLLQSSSKSESCTKKEMRSLIKCVGKSNRLLDFVLLTEPQYMQHIDMKRLTDKGRKVWRTMQLRTLVHSDLPKYSSTHSMSW